MTNGSTRSSRAENAWPSLACIRLAVQSPISPAGYDLHFNHRDGEMNTLRDGTPWLQCTTMRWCMLMGTLRSVSAQLINLSWADSFEVWLSRNVQSFRRKLKCLLATEQTSANVITSIQTGNMKPGYCSILAYGTVTLAGFRFVAALTLALLLKPHSLWIHFQEN